MGCEAVERNVGAVVKVVHNLREYFLKLSAFRNVHAVEIIVLDELVVCFDKGIGIVYIHPGDVLLNRMPKGIEQCF